MIKKNQRSQIIVCLLVAIAGMNVDQCIGKTMPKIIMAVDGTIQPLPVVMSEPLVEQELVSTSEPAEAPMALPQEEEVLCDDAIQASAALVPQPEEPATSSFMDQLLTYHNLYEYGLMGIGLMAFIICASKLQSKTVNA